MPIDATTRMQLDLERHAAAVADAVDNRNDLIADAHTAGLSLRAIAAAVGLSHTNIANIIKGT